MQNSAERRKEVYIAGLKKDIDKLEKHRAKIIKASCDRWTEKNGTRLESLQKMLAEAEPETKGQGGANADQRQDA